MEDDISIASDAESSTQPTKPSNRGRSSTPASSLPAKRSRTRSGSRRDLKRQRQNYRDQYRHLLNEQITQAADPYALCDDDDLRDYTPSQIGMSFWSAIDKFRFFTALDRHGRHDLPALGKAVGTKSALEVQQYLNVLGQGLREQHKDFRRETLLRYADVPAAVEVGEECCARLQDAADALQLLQGSAEIRAERVKRGRYWNVNGEVAWDVEDDVVGVMEGMRREEVADGSVALDEDFREKEHGEKGSDEHYQRLKPALLLFDTPMWLELSARVFMNSPPLSSTSTTPEEGPRNWTEVLPPTHPSIFATALLDFRTLAVTITKRIAYTAHFQAMSRIRATDVYAYREKRNQGITKHDVRAALDILGLQRNAKDFWIKAARRHSLDVYDPPGRKKQDMPIWERRKLGRRLSYEEMERKLRKSHWRKGRERGHEKGEDAGGELSDGDRDVNEFEIPETPEDELALLHEEDAERVDRISSARGEMRLWRDVLERAVPEHLVEMTEATGGDGDKRPRVQRKNADDLKDWKDGLKYVEPWEADGCSFDFEAARGRVEKRRETKKRGLREEEGDVEMEDAEELSGDEGESGSGEDQGVSGGSSSGNDSSRGGGGDSSDDKSNGSSSDEGSDNSDTDSSDTSPESRTGGERSDSSDF